MKSRLLWKLLAINLPIIVVVILVVWLAIDFLAADYFSTLMHKYNISPTETNQMFLDAIHRYLIQASLIALALAAGLSFFLTRRVLRPLSEAVEATRRISKGDYSARVRAITADEMGELAKAFNQMVDSLEEIEQLRKNLVVDVAHELRTPLTTIRGHLEGLADGVLPPSKETFHMLEQEVLRLVRLVEDLNQLARADAAWAYLRRDEVFLPGLVNRVLELYQNELRERDIHVKTDLDGAGAYVTADGDKLVQALNNLMKNAWQYTPPGGEIRISAERVEEGVRITFANTGEPIGKEDIPFIFERFYRADKSRSRGSGGAGIGLAIVKGLIEAHGGRVGASSAGGLTRIWFTLPA